jgi:GNAT superfamily N-acetyltransferase
MVSYRNVEQKDKKDFIEIERAFYQLYADLGINKHLKPVPSQEIPESVFVNSFEESLRGDHFFFAADVDGKMIGYIFAEIQDVSAPQAYEIKKVGFIDSLFVKSEYRGQGIGKELIKRAEEWTKSKGCNICTIGVRDENKEALKLYEALGFTKANIKMWKEL